MIQFLKQLFCKHKEWTVVKRTEANKYLFVCSRCNSSKIA